MVKLPFPTGWMPWPQRLAPGRGRRLAALALLALAVASMVWTLVVWRADAADRQGDYAGAVFWRPEVALYRRHWGEALLLTAPRQAEAQLLAAVRLDPYDPLTIADLTTVELALGHWPEAVAMNQQRRGRKPDFYDYWRLANLFLSHGDLAGYWQQFRLAAVLAQPSALAPMVSRSLTASGQDFTSLRGALPAHSVAAASAYLAAAADAGDLAAVDDGASWLAALPPPTAPALRTQRQQAVLEVVLTAWRRWPTEAARLDQDAVTMGALPAPAKTAASPFIFNGNFDPTAYAAARRLAPNPADDLSALIGWQTPAAPHTQMHEVQTGEATHPTAAEILLDGSEPDDITLAQQWFLAAGGTQLSLTLAGRSLSDQSSLSGISVRVINLNGQPVSSAPLTFPPHWGGLHATATLPGRGVQAWKIELHYHRPNGQLPMNGRVLITALALE